MKIELHIDRLLLDGLPFAQREAALVKAAVELELGRLMAAGQIDASLASAAAIPMLRGGSIAAPRNAEPGRTGTQIAAAVYAGFGERQ